MISRSLEGLGYQQKIRTIFTRTAIRTLEMPSKHRMASLVNPRIILQYLIRRFNLTLHETFMNAFQHGLQGGGHGQQIPLIEWQEPRSHKL